LTVLLLAVPVAGAISGASWNGAVRDAAGKAMAEATVKLHSISGGSDYMATTTQTASLRLAKSAQAATTYQ